MIYYQSFVDLNQFKVCLLHEEATEIESIDFVGLHNSTKDYVSANTNINVQNLRAYLNTYYHESIFLSKENSKIWCNY